MRLESRRNRRWRIAWVFIIFPLIFLIFELRPVIHNDIVQTRSVHRHSALESSSKEAGPVVAYVISLIRCGDFQSNILGMSDAIAVLRHSVHRFSIRNSLQLSRYDYQFYALVHTQAESCSSQLLSELGIKVIVRDTPIQLSEIQSDVLRGKVSRAWCCGEQEFIKLYAYTLIDHPIVVHMDVDFLLTKPMDILFDAMLHPFDSPRGLAARNALPREFPDQQIPEDIQAMMTRDWGQVIPGRKPGFQAGFFVIRPSLQVFDTILNTIRTADYVDGYSRQNGWGGKGYGGFVGAEAMQGLVAYYYDEVAPGNWVELNACRFNHMGMDMKYRAPPNFARNHPKVGMCRNDRDYCEDCQTTSVENIYSIHYTQCRKPWMCIAESTSILGKTGLPANNVDIPHCLELAKTWHSFRKELEKEIGIKGFSDGSYFPHVFQGHCKSSGGASYQPFTDKSLARQQIFNFYQ